MRRDPKGIVRRIQDDTSNREQWLKLADAIGEELAVRDFNRLFKSGEGADEAEKQGRGDLRSVLKRPAKRKLDR